MEGSRVRKIEVGCLEVKIKLVLASYNRFIVSKSCINSSV